MDWRRCLCACGGLDSSAWTVPPPPVCLLHNMNYDSTILLFIYYSISEVVWSRFPYTLTKPSQRVRVTWIDHRAGIPSGVDVIGIFPFYGSCLLPFALVATADSRASRVDHDGSPATWTSSSPDSSHISTGSKMSNLSFVLGSMCKIDITTRRANAGDTAVMTAVEPGPKQHCHSLYL